MRPKPEEERDRRSLTEGNPQKPLTKGAPYKGASQAPARSARPCSATASRSQGRAGQGRGEDKPKANEPSSCA